MESWLDKGIADLEIAIPGYISLRSDRDRYGGGILIYIKNLLCFSTLPSPSSDIKLLTIIIQHNVMPAIICLSVFYRPSSGPESLDAFCDYFDAIDSAQYTNFVLLGDFNVDMSGTHPLFHKLNNIASTYYLSDTG